MGCVMYAQLGNVWPAVQLGDLEVCLTSTLSGVPSSFAANSAAVRTLLCQSVGDQAAEVLRTTTAVVCCLRQKRVDLRSAEAAWLIASVSSAID